MKFLRERRCAPQIVLFALFLLCALVLVSCSMGENLSVFDDPSTDPLDIYNAPDAPSAEKNEPGVESDDYTIILDVTTPAPEDSIDVDVEPLPNETSPSDSLDVPNPGVCMHGARDETEVELEPTCVTKGLMRSVCIQCGVLVEYKDIPMKDHVETPIEPVSPTCTSAGHTNGSYCSVCEQVLVVPIELPVVSHNYMLLQSDVDRLPTCTENGYQDYQCTVCGDLTTVTVAATGHVPTTTEQILQAPTCIESGLGTQTFCSVCEAVLTEAEVLPPTGHQYDTWTVLEGATCVKLGVAEGTCVLCGEYGTLDLPTREHTRELIPALMATCLEDGYEAYECCIVCRELYTEYIVLPATGHKSVYMEKILPTCDTPGYEEGTKCLNCGLVTGKGELAPTGHTRVLGADKIEPTCAAPGRNALYVCDVCAIPLDGGEEIGVLDHTPSVWAVVETPTFDESGLRALLCQYCDAYCETRDIASIAESNYGYGALLLETNGNGKQRFYRDLYDACIRFRDGNTNKKTQELIGEFYGTTYGLSVDELVAVWSAFYVENPQFYWMDNTVSWSTTLIPTLYVYASADYGLKADREAFDLAILEMENEFLTLAEGITDEASLVKLIYEFIIGRIDYSYDQYGKPEDALWAHNLVGIATEQGGVCETYAKAYLHLARLVSLDAIIVTGDAGGAHAWNYVSIDGQWYAVDSTWDDGGSMPNYVHLAVSMYTIGRFHDENRPTGTGVNYLYALPTLSRNDYVFAVALDAA